MHSLTSFWVEGRQYRSFYPSAGLSGRNNLVPQFCDSKVRSLNPRDHQIRFEETVKQLDRRFCLTFDRDYITKPAKDFVERTSVPTDRAKQRKKAN
jgi:hypothetical protein